jgi:hypothetical protein
MHIDSTDHENTSLLPAYLPTLTNPHRITHQASFVIGLKPRPYRPKRPGKIRVRLLVAGMLLLILFAIYAVLFQQLISIYPNRRDENTS